MEVFIDADACPVVDAAIRLAAEQGVACSLLCDTAHELNRPGARTITVEKGADSVDFRLVNLIHAGDIAVTQDYGLAAMCLARRAAAINQNGLIYSQENMDGLLLSRYTSQKIRRAGGRTKGPSKRTPEQDRAFETAFRSLLCRCAAGS